MLLRSALIQAVRHDNDWDPLGHPSRNPGIGSQIGADETTPSNFA
jgi:hypothetical protein